MNNPLKLKSAKTFAHLMLFILVSGESIAQLSQPVRQKYAGFNVNFGLRTFRSVSNYYEINRNKVGLQGGQFGIVAGNSIVRSTVGIFGYYTSVTDIVGTIDLYESNASVNFYPMGLIRKKDSHVEPYIIAGVNYDQLKFYGSYLKKDAGVPNYSVAELPYLGGIKQVNGTIGAGFEVKILDDDNFVHVFTEIKYGHNFYSYVSRAEFNDTTINNHWMVSIGTKFGQIR